MLLLLACTGAPAPDDTGDTADTAAECTFLEPDTRLVLADACVDGVCGGTVYVDVVAALGAPDSCTAASYRATCAWGDLSINFPDCDDDGNADETYLCDMFSQDLVLSGAWDGASAEGLGLGVPVACWEEALGPQSSWGGWTFDGNPWVHVKVEPAEGPVTTIRLEWNWDE